MWQDRFARWVLLFCIACLASACGALQTDLTFYTGERYHAVTTITVSSQLLALAGGDAAAEPQLDRAVAQAEASGAQAAWRRGASPGPDQIVYVVEISGTGYGPPLSDNFDVQTVEIDGREALKVSVIPGAQLIGSGLGVSTLVIHGGQIVDTNGMKTGEDTVTFNQTSMLTSGAMPYVTLSPKGGLTPDFPWLYVGIGVGGIALLGLIGFLVFRSRPKKRYAGAVFCPHCGAPQARGTRICARCRRPLPLR